LFIKRWKSGNGKENIDRDDTQFLELEREIFQNYFPLYYADLFDDEDDEDEEEDENNEDKHTGKGKDDQYSDNNGWEGPRLQNSECASLRRRGSVIHIINSQFCLYIVSKS